MSLSWFATENLDARGNTKLPYIEYDAPVRTEQIATERVRNA